VSAPERRPTLNHVAMSMDPAVLDEQGRADVLAFYGEVFGWTEGDNTGESGNPLILYTALPGARVFVRWPACPPVRARRWLLHPSWLSRRCFWRIPPRPIRTPLP
jgi:hypothetical protein